MSLLSDLRYATRLLRKHPGFALVTVLLLGLGIGANSALFSAVHAALVRPLPFAHSDRLVSLSETVQRDTGEEPRPFSFPDFLDVREGVATFDAVGAYASAGLTLGSDAAPERVGAEWVTEGYLQALGARAVLGRTFSQEEDTVAGAHPVVVLGHGLWVRRFGASPAVLGRTVVLNDRAFTVVGVLSEDFRGWTREADLWVPMAMASMVEGERVLTSRGHRWHDAVARLRPGASLAQAQEQLDTVMAGLAQAHAGTNSRRGARITPAREALFGDLRPALLMLWGAVGFVLLSVCANVANLLLARATERQGEMAVRAALGASRARLAWQLMVEGLLLTLLGGTVGLLLAVWLIDVLHVLVPEPLRPFLRLQLDGAVVGFNALATVGAGLLCAVLPALRLADPAAGGGLRSGGTAGTAAPGRRRLRSLLVGTNVALALVLLIGAGLMVGAFRRVLRVDPGFRPEGVATLSVSLPRQRTPEQARAFAARLAERLSAVPGVEGASVASDVPLSGSSDATMVGIQREGEGDIERVRVYRHSIDGGFLATVGIPLLEGRLLTSADGPAAPRVALVSRAMAQRFWPGRSAVGQRFLLNPGTPVEVVGVVGDARYVRLTGGPVHDPDVYFPLAQTAAYTLTAAARSAMLPSLLLEQMRLVLREVDPTLAVDDASTLEASVAREAAAPRFNALLLGAFAAMALALAALGLYGLVSYVASQRQREMGLRMALGASAGDVLRLILWQGLRPVLAGVAVGMPVAVGLARLVASQVQEVEGAQPALYLGLSALLLAVAAASCFLPAMRGTRVDPAIALRAE